MLEALMHETSSFWTLTYDDNHLPTDGSLVPDDLKNFMKRLRLRTKCRFFAVGEYGDDTWRPHYHLALFGVERCVCPVRKLCVCDPHIAWGKGFTVGLSLTPESAAYIAGYVVKKLTRKDDDRLSGRAPEFARMSLRPGIGAPAIAVLGEAYSDPAAAEALTKDGDVPSVLKHGVSSYPLGRYLRSKLRQEIGMSDGEAPDDWSVKASEEMRVMYGDALRASSFNLSQVISQLSEQRLRQVEGKQNIYRSRRRAKL